ncbi:MAG: transcription termination factor Rho [Clostridiales bacterium]|nr:transcription termination factor Rho [Clostridiales bacterium]
MREKYESLSLAVLKDLAKARGMKRISTLKKGELIERMLLQDEQDAQAAREKEEQAAAQNAQSSEEESRAEEETGKKNVYDIPLEEQKPEKKNHISDENRYHEKKDGGEQESEEKAPVAGQHQRRKTDAVSEEQRWSKKSGATGGFQRRDGDQRQRMSWDDRKHAPAARDGRQEEGRQRTARPSGGKTDDFSDERLRTIDDRTVQKMETEGISMADLDSGEKADGILEVMPDGYGFIRCENYLPGDQDVYVSPSQIRRFKLKTGDIISGNKRIRSQGEKFSALLYISTVNDISPSVAAQRTPFEDLTPIFPNERLRLERPAQAGAVSSSRMAMRIVDLIAPVGKGQRGMIVSQPKAGKTTLLKEIAASVKSNNPDMHLIILLIDERPEEVTDIKEAIEGENVEVIYSTFDELPEHHKRVSEMVIERAKRLVEHKKDVMILLDSITRLARAYNLVVPPSGRTLSGGLDPAALHMPKRFFGAARNMREGGSLTILATALVDTGSRMDDVVYEEFKGTGNMELILDRKLSEKRIFPAIDIVKSGTRREDLLLTHDEKEAVDIMRRSLNGMKTDDAVESILRMFLKTRNNREFISQVRHRKFF